MVENWGVRGSSLIEPTPVVVPGCSLLTSPLGLSPCRLRQQQVAAWKSEASGRLPMRLWGNACSQVTPEKHVDDPVDLGTILYWLVYRFDDELQEDVVKVAEREDTPIETRETCVDTSEERDGPCQDPERTVIVTNSEPVRQKTRRPRRLLTKSLSLTRLSQLLSPCRTPLKSLRQRRRSRAEAAAVSSVSTPSTPSTARESIRGQSPLWGRACVMESAPQHQIRTEEGEEGRGTQDEMLPSPSRPGKEEEGEGDDFVRKVPPSELQKIEGFRAALRDAGVVLTPSYMAANFNEPEHSLLYRFLVARDYNYERATRMLVEDIKWRDGWGDGAGMLAWHAQSLEEVVGMPEDEYERHYWSRFLTYDQDDGGCPVFYRSLTGMRTWELLKHTSVERVVQHLLWEFEQHSAYLFHHPPAFPCRQLKYIISIKDMDWPQLTSDLLGILSGFSDVSKLHHPERLKQLFIVHAPWAFGVAWSLLTPFIPPKTREKVCILNCTQTDKHPVVSRWLQHLRPPARP